MGLADYIISEADLNSGVGSLPDRPSEQGISAAQLKAAFDNLSKNIVGVKMNGLIGALIALGAENLVQSEDVRAIRLNDDGMLETSDDGENWTLCSSGGHLIADGAGTIYPQRSRLKFAGQTTVSDDGTYTVISGLKGDKGDTGDTGAQGPQGETGATGARGEVLIPAVSTEGILSWSVAETSDIPQSVNIRGPQGVQGTQGVQGPQGIQGIQGVQGPQGPQGLQGNDGRDGRSFTIQDVYATLGALKAAFPTGNEYAYQVSADHNIYIWSEAETDWISLGQLQGPQGPQGIQGVQGNQGPQGIQGNPGNDGKSAYQSAVEAGYSGTEATFCQAIAEVPGHIENTTAHITSAERTAWNDKVSQVSGKGLSTNDYTNAEKTKLAGIAAGANKTVVDTVLSNTSANPLANSAIYSALAGKAVKTSYTASVGTSWSGTEAPYTQAVTVNGILASDDPHIMPIFSVTAATALLEKEAWNQISYALTSANTITFTCLESAPTQSINVKIEVVR